MEKNGDGVTEIHQEVLRSAKNGKNGGGNGKKWRWRLNEIHLEVLSSANSQREDIGYSLMEARVGTCVMMMVMMEAMMMIYI